MIRALVLIVPLAAAACATTPNPCDGRPGTCVGILVDNSPVLDEVRVTFTADGLVGSPRQSTSTNPTGRLFSAPFDLAVTIDDTLITTTLTANVLVVGYKAGLLVAQGNKPEQTVNHGANPPIHLSLAPTSDGGVDLMVPALDSGLADLAVMDASMMVVDGDTPKDLAEVETLPDGAPCNSTSCPSGLSCCNGSCVDRLSDIKNCGACSNACNTTTELCCGGSCASRDSTHCMSCTQPCNGTNLHCCPCGASTTCGMALCLGCGT